MDVKDLDTGQRSPTRALGQRRQSASDPIATPAGCKTEFTGAAATGLGGSCAPTRFRPL